MNPDTRIRMIVLKIKKPYIAREMMDISVQPNRKKSLHYLDAETFVLSGC